MCHYMSNIISGNFIGLSNKLITNYVIYMYNKCMCSKILKSEKNINKPFFYFLNK